MTTFYALFQGEYGSDEGADLIGVFSTPGKALELQTMLSTEHTRLKRDAFEAKQNRVPAEEIPDLYWDIRPVLFDPRDLDEL